MTEMRFEHRMSDSDALMWTIEKDPLLRSTITAVCLFDRTPDRDRLTAAVDRCSRLVPRLRQRVVSNPWSLAPPRWEADPHFDLAFHLRWIRPAGAGTLRDLLDLAAPIAMQGFDRARPLWELVVVEGLEDGRAAVVLKLHHAITDGVGGIKLAMNLFDLGPEATDHGPMPAPPAAHVFNPLERIVDGVDHERRRQLGIASRVLPTVARGLGTGWRDPAGTARQLAATVASVGRLLTPATQPMSPVMGGRSLSVHFDAVRVPLAELKGAARRADAKLNDAFVAAVLGGLRRYHRQHGSSAPALRMTMPINVRNAATDALAGNAFVPARFAVPLDIDDPVERMRAVRSLVAGARAEPSMGLVEPLASVLYRLPTTVSTGVFGAMLKGVDLVTSNVPGVPVPVYLAGARMEAQFPFGPLAGAAINITLLSYLDEVQLGVNVDPAAVPDHDVFQACLVDGVDEVCKLA